MRNTSAHCWSTAQGPVNLDEIIREVIQSYSRLAVGCCYVRIPRLMTPSKLGMTSLRKESRGLRADAFHEHEFAIFDGQDHGRLHGVAIFINGDGSGNSRKVLGLGDGVANLGGLGGIGAANGVHQDVSRIVGPGRERV